MPRTRAPVRPGGLFPTYDGNPTRPNGVYDETLAPYPPMPGAPVLGDFAAALDSDPMWGTVVTPGDTPMQPAQSSGAPRPHSPSTYPENPRPNAPYRPTTPAMPMNVDLNAALGGAPLGTTQTTNNGYQAVGPYEFMGPVLPPTMGGGPGTYNQSGSCRPRLTCAQKCARDEHLKAQCKGCKAYFRRTKNYIYPKRKRYTRRRRTYRKKSCGKSKLPRGVTRSMYKSQDRKNKLSIQRQQAANAIDAQAWRSYKVYRGWT